MSVRVLGISASPRGKANSYYLLEKALAGVNEVVPEATVDVYTFDQKHFSGCLHCRRCRETGSCVVLDDFQDLAGRWGRASAILYSVPVYHMSIPGQLKCFIDRLGQSSFSKLAARKQGVLPSEPMKCIGIIAQGAHLFSGQEHATSMLIQHALLMGCVPVSGYLPESYIGAGAWTECLADRDAIKRLNERGSPAARASVSAAESVGKRVAAVARMVQAGWTAVSSGGSTHLGGDREKRTSRGGDCPRRL